MVGKCVEVHKISSEHVAVDGCDNKPMHAMKIWSAASLPFQCP